MKLAPGLHSHTTDAAISSPWPRRPIGVAAAASARSSSPLAAMAATLGVSLGPAQPALIPLPPRAHHSAAAVAGGCALAGGRGERGLVDVRDDDRGDGLGERACGGKAHAGAPTRHECYLSSEVVGRVHKP